MKKVIVVVVIVIVSILVVAIAKDQVIKSVITAAATKVTGAPVHIQAFHLGVFSQSVRISGLKLYNPQGFTKNILLDLPKVNVTFDLGALLKKRLHLAALEIELKEMGLEKNKEGKLNVDVLELTKQQGKKEGGKPSEQIPMQIDRLKLGIGRIVFKDYSAKGGPVIKVYDININKSFKNITSAQQLAALVLTEPMKQAGIKGAEIYGVVMLAGLAVLPVAVAVTFTGKDSVKKEFLVGVDNAYEVSLAVLKQMGKITREDRANGTIGADINSDQIALKIRKKPDNKTEITISARSYLFPKPEIAGGVLYEISVRLK